MHVHVQTILESIHQLRNTILYYDEIKENIFLIDIVCFSMKQILSSLFVIVYKWSILNLITTFHELLINKFLVFVSQ